MVNLNLQDYFRWVFFVKRVSEPERERERDDIAHKQVYLKQKRATKTNPTTLNK